MENLCMVKLCASIWTELLKFTITHDEAHRMLNVWDELNDYADELEGDEPLEEIPVRMPNKAGFKEYTINVTGAEGRADSAFNGNSVYTFSKEPIPLRHGDAWLNPETREQRFYWKPAKEWISAEDWDDLEDVQKVKSVSYEGVNVPASEADVFTAESLGIEQPDFVHGTAKIVSGKLTLWDHALKAFVGVNRFVQSFNEVEQRMRADISNNQKLSACKAYRDATGDSLKNAKLYVDRLAVEIANERLEAARKGR